MKTDVFCFQVLMIRSTVLAETQNKSRDYRDQGFGIAKSYTEHHSSFSGRLYSTIEFRNKRSG